MSGRLTRIVALLTVVTHVWVSLIVAPWHQLEAHLLPAVTVVRDALRPGNSCGCHHHACRRGPVATANDRGESPAQAPAAPEHDDDCSICQMVAQPFAAIGEPPAVAYCERQEGICCRTAPRILSRFVCRPVSRGPPSCVAANELAVRGLSKNRRAAIDSI